VRWSALRLSIRSLCEYSLLSAFHISKFVVSTASIAGEPTSRVSSCGKTQNLGSVIISFFCPRPPILLLPEPSFLRSSSPSLLLHRSPSVASPSSQPLALLKITPQTQHPQSMLCQKLARLARIAEKGEEGSFFHHSSRTLALLTRSGPASSTRALVRTIARHAACRR
jgi:hypothetical protein